MLRLLLLFAAVFCLGVLPACDGSGVADEAGGGSDGDGTHDSTRASSETRGGSGGGEGPGGGPGGEAGAGQDELELAWNQMDGRGLTILAEMTRGNAYEGELTSADDVGENRFDLYALEARDKADGRWDEFTLTLASTAFETYLYLYRDEGNGVWTRVRGIEGDDGGEAHFTQMYCSSQEAGRYIVLVTAFYSDETRSVEDREGAYTLYYDDGLLERYSR